MKKLLLTLYLAGASLLAAAHDLPASDAVFAARLTGLDGKPAALSRYQGKPLIVNFWARWCAPCRAEIPELAAYRKAMLGKVEVLGIGIEDEAGPAREFAKKHGMDYPVVIAREQGFPLMQALGNGKGMLPYTLFIDRHGKVVQAKAGQIRQADLAGAEEKLLAR